MAVRVYIETTTGRFFDFKDVRDAKVKDNLVIIVEDKGKKYVIPVERLLLMKIFETEDES